MTLLGNFTCQRASILCHTFAPFAGMLCVWFHIKSCISFVDSGCFRHISWFVLIIIVIIILSYHSWKLFFVLFIVLQHYYHFVVIYIYRCIHCINLQPVMGLRQWVSRLRLKALNIRTKAKTVTGCIQWALSWIWTWKGSWSVRNHCISWKADA